MLRSIVIILVCLLTCAVLPAQETELTGTIYDVESSEPIPYSTIEIFRDSLLIGGTISDSLGRFQVEINSRWTLMRVCFIGYHALLKPAAEMENQEHLSIFLLRNAELLEEVIINEQRSNTELKIDRKIINLNSDIQNSGVNALEAFDQIAEVDVDLGNNKVSLRGNANIQILINGKPTALSATEILNQIPASSIDRIEIITSPSVKYQASGISGIINIILKREENLGLNLKTYATAGTRRYSFGASANYSTSKINYRFNASRAFRKETNFQTIERQFDSGFFEGIFTPYELSGGVNKIALGVDVFLNQKHEFSFGVDYTDDGHSYFNESQFSNQAGNFTKTYLRQNEHQHNTSVFDANYRFKFTEPQHFIEFDCQLNSSKNSYPYQDSEDHVFLQEQNLSEDFIIQSNALDYSVPLSNNALLEAGISYNTQQLESQFLLTKRDTSLQDQFDYDESVLGLYGLFHFSFRKWKIQTGLRFEQFRSSMQIESETLGRSRTFHNLFPSLHFSYRFNEYTNLTFGYSQRIERPNFHHSNAFQIVSPLFDWQYNPSIIPEISRNLDLSMQTYHDKWSLGLSGFYRIRKDVILWTSFAENTRQIFRYENSGVFNSFGIELNSKISILDFWESSLSANYYHHQINQATAVTWHTNYSSRVQLKNTWKLTRQLTSDLIYMLLPERQTAFSKLLPRNRVDFSLNGNFWKGRLTIGFRMVDVFNQNLIQRQSQTIGLYQETAWDIQYQSRNFLINLNYNLYDKKIKSRNEKNRKYNKPLIE